jgi:hypothetical protein
MYVGRALQRPLRRGHLLPEQAAQFRQSLPGNAFADDTGQFSVKNRRVAMAILADHQKKGSFAIGLVLRSKRRLALPWPRPAVCGWKILRKGGNAPGLRVWEEVSQVFLSLKAVRFHGQDEWLGDMGGRNLARKCAIIVHFFHTDRHCSQLVTILQWRSQCQVHA